MVKYPREMDSKQFEKVKNTLNFVLRNKSSTFYKSKYFGLKIKTPEDFLNLPFLDRGEIAKCPPNSRLFIPSDKVGLWTMTSGTTSAYPLLIPVCTQKQDYLDLLARKLSKNKVEKIMLLKPAGYSYLRIFDWNSHPKLRGYPLIWGDMRNLEMTARIAGDLGVDALETTPSALNFLIPYLGKVNGLSQIKCIILGGEFTSERKYEFFKANFPNAYFDFTFGGNETRGKKGLRCDNLNRNFAPRFFHPRVDYFYFEVVDQKGLPAAEGETGELVVTTLFKTPFPLVRYKTGDLVSITKSGCICGRRRLMEVFGRVGTDSARVGGVTLYTHLIDEALAREPIGDWQMHLYEEEFEKRLMPRLVLRLSNIKADRARLIQDRVEKNLKVGPNLYLAKLIEDGVFLPLKVQAVAGFEQNFKQARIVSHLK